MRQIITSALFASIIISTVQPISAAENISNSKEIKETTEQKSSSNADSKTEEGEKINPPAENITPKPNLPANYYQQLGIPGIKQAWSPLDYLNTANILSSLAKQKLQNIPHYGDPIGRPYMQHMVDGKNFYNTLRFASTHEQRLELIMMYLDGVQRIFAVYQQALNQSYPYYAEWIDIIGLSSYLAALSQPEWDYYLQQATANNPQAFNNPELDQKIQAITLLQTALVNPVITGVQALPKMPAPLAWRLLQQLNYSLPIYAGSLPLDALEQLQQAFTQAYQQSKDARVREAIRQMITQLYNSARI